MGGVSGNWAKAGRSGRPGVVEIQETSLVGAKSAPRFGMTTKAQGKSNRKGCPAAPAATGEGRR